MRGLVMRAGGRTRVDKNVRLRMSGSVVTDSLTCQSTSSSSLAWRNARGLATGLSVPGVRSEIDVHDNELRDVAPARRARFCGDFLTDSTLGFRQFVGPRKIHACAAALFSASEAAGTADRDRNRDGILCVTHSRRRLHRSARRHRGTSLRVRPSLVRGVVRTVDDLTKPG